MNQISWLLYAGNVLGNLGPLFFIMGLISAIAGLALTAVFYHQRDKTIDQTAYVPNTAEVIKLLTSLGARRCWWPAVFLPITLVFWILAAMCPSQDTVYAMAASELGGKAMASPTVSKATQALDAWLDKQTQSLKKADDK